MNFGSKFVYQYDQDEVEDYMGLAEVIETKSNAAEPHKNRKWRRADTNVISARFDQLSSPSDMNTGDPIYCEGCQAVLSLISTIIDKAWKCEYCNKVNQVDISADEISKKNDLTFMLQPAATTTGHTSSPDEKLTKADGSLVVFCIDVSGSMSSDTRVPGRVNLFHAGSTRTRYQESRDVTLVSRLEAVQVAVGRQLEEIAETSPDTRVALVTFHTQVTAIGDGSSAIPLTFNGAHKTADELKAMGRTLPLPQKAVHTKNKLMERVSELQTESATALGPALLLSVVIASQVPGSKVIICTDGMANVGLGSLGSYRGEDAAYDEATQFYNDTATYASDNGVSISVITFKGTDCRLAELGHVAAQTEGHVNIVDPMKLTEEFGNILIDNTIATNVTATFILHQGLYIRNEDGLPSKVMKQFGNVSKDTEITFEYGIRLDEKKKDSKPNDEQPKSNEKEKKEDSKPNDEQPMAITTPSTEDAGARPSTSVDAPASAASVKGLKELPFQLQIVYTDMEGGKAMRVISQNLPITTQRKEAEEHMKARVLMTHATKMNANLALQGQYTNAKMNLRSKAALMQRNQQSTQKQNAYHEYLDCNVDLLDDIEQYECAEKTTYGRALSDSEGSDDEDQAQVFKVKGKKKKVIQQRQQNRGDATSKKLFSKMKKAFKRGDYSDDEDDTPVTVSQNTNNTKM